MDGPRPVGRRRLSHDNQLRVDGIRSTLVEGKRWGLIQYKAVVPSRIRSMGNSVDVDE